VIFKASVFTDGRLFISHRQTALPRIHLLEGGASSPPFPMHAKVPVAALELG
jgi:hypothetical protein